jgi:hypothetical protein
MFLKCDPYTVWCSILYNFNVSLRMFPYLSQKWTCCTMILKRMQLMSLEYNIEHQTVYGSHFRNMGAPFMWILIIKLQQLEKKYCRFFLIADTCLFVNSSINRTQLLPGCWSIHIKKLIYMRPLYGRREGRSAKHTTNNPKFKVPLHTYPKLSQTSQSLNLIL